MQLGEKGGRLLCKGHDVLLDAQQAMPEMTDALLWLYGVAFEELRRAIACDCKERAELLGFMWSHGFRLLEMRQSLAHHIGMLDAHSAVTDARQQQLAAQQRMR